MFRFMAEQVSPTKKDSFFGGSIHIRRQMFFWYFWPTYSKLSIIRPGRSRLLEFWNWDSTNLFFEAANSQINRDPSIAEVMLGEKIGDDKSWQFSLHYGHYPLFSCFVQFYNIFLWFSNKICTHLVIKFLKITSIEAVCNM